MTEVWSRLYPVHHWKPGWTQGDCLGRFDIPFLTISGGLSVIRDWFLLVGPYFEWTRQFISISLNSLNILNNIGWVEVDATKRFLPMIPMTVGVTPRLTLAGGLQRKYTLKPHLGIIKLDGCYFQDELKKTSVHVGLANRWQGWHTAQPLARCGLSGEMGWNMLEPANRDNWWWSIQWCDIISRLKILYY